jgi:hypothetical protein
VLIGVDQHRSDNHSGIIDRTITQASSIGVFFIIFLINYLGMVDHLAQLLGCVKGVFFGFSGRKVEEAETKMGWSVNLFAKVMGQPSFN